MAPDLDVLIQSPRDPLLFLEFHRHFTHSFAFIPIGALICAGAFHWFVRRRLRFRDTYLFCLLGYASHGLLDACTTYGTQLFWPFSSARVAWHVVSVVDPFFTVPLALLAAAAWYWRRRTYALLGLAWGLAYLGTGAILNQRAEDLGRALAEARGHAPVRLEAKPSFANLVVWKIVYEHDGRYYVDAVRTSILGPDRTYPGQSVEKLDIGRHFPWLDPSSVQAGDVERFRWFSDDYLALDPARSEHVIDVRYSVLPNEIRALWGIRLKRQAPPDAHVDYFTDRNASPDQGGRLLQMIFD
jgi:inner membrane protein